MRPAARRGLRLLAAGLAFTAAALSSQTSAAQTPRLQIWCRDAAGAMTEGAEDDAPIAVGSLQKPFVARAWAAAHPGAPSPRFRCEAGSGCWLPAGHGELGLAAALARSCNTYFRHLAEATPQEGLEASLRAAGFTRGPRSPEEAIGLPGPDGPLRVSPAALLRAYAELTRLSWAAGAPIRAEVLAGLREAGLDGTAKALGRRGYWAKTGTVPASDGDPRHTCGLALAVEDSGWSILARLEPGSGRDAAAALADALAQRRPWSPPHGADPTPRETRPVRVRMFDLVPAQRWEVRNLGNAPIPAGGGYLGPGGARALQAGDRIGPGRLEVRAADSGALRRFEGQLLCLPGRSGRPRLLGILSARAYVSGVVAAEAPRATADLREQLGAAVLRFLARGPRHADADVCDTTHCAWFVGQGPRLDWWDPHHATAVSGPEDPGFDDGAWARVLAAAREPGPDQWTAHCGGEPLPPYAVWGGGARTAAPCPRHPAPTAPWTRFWRARDVERAFGPGARGLTVGMDHGIWVLRVAADAGPRALRYDEAHRALAGVLGWDALPSPADRIEGAEGGYLVTGHGSGHRVGLCLGD